MQKIDMIATTALAKLVQAGTDKAQCVACMSEKQEFNVEGGEFSLFRTLFNTDMTLVAYKDNKKGTVKINSFSDEEIDRGVKEAMQVAESSAADEAYDIAPRQDEKNFKDGIGEPDLDKFFKRVKEFVDTVKNEYPKINIAQLIAAYNNKFYCYRDTNGTNIIANNGTYSISVGMTAVDGEKVTSANYFGFTTTDLETPFIEQGGARKRMEKTISILDAKPLDHKFTGTMVMADEALGEFMYFLIDNYIESEVIKDKTSQWYGKLNEKVADEKLTVKLSVSDPRIVSKDRFTSDGYVAEDVTLIDKGVIKQYFIDIYTANKSGFPVCKNDSYNMIIEPGNTSYDDMIKDIKEGIIVGMFSGGHPNVDGEFSGVAKNSFYIKDGKIAGPVSEAMINGNLGDIFNNIRAVSKEVGTDGSAVVPAMVFDGVVVSGK